MVSGPQSILISVTSSFFISYVVQYFSSLSLSFFNYKLSIKIFIQMYLDLSTCLPVNLLTVPCRQALLWNHFFPETCPLVSFQFLWFSPRGLSHIYFCVLKSSTFSTILAFSQSPCFLFNRRLKDLEEICQKFSPQFY